MLQADSEKLRQAWVQAVQASIASAYRESPDSCYSEVWPTLPFHLHMLACVSMRQLLQAACVCVCSAMYTHVRAVCVHTCECLGLCLRAPDWGGGRACRGVGLNGPSHCPRGWTAQHLRPQAASILPRTLGNAVSRVRVCYSGYRAWLAMASVATVASQTPAGPASTLACYSALSAQASTGGLPDSVGWGRAKPGGAAT